MIQNSKLRAIAERAAGDLQAFIGESEENILKAWSAATEEAQDNETKAKLKLGFSVTLNLDDDVMSTALSFGIKHTLSRDGEIPDPDQAKLSLGDEPESEEDKEFREKADEYIDGISKSKKLRSPKDS